MKNFGRPLLVGLGITLALVSPGFGAKSAPEFRLGVNAELTGPKSAIGDSCKKAVDLLAVQINQGGELKVGDRKIPLKLSIADNGDQAKLAVAAAQKLIARIRLWPSQGLLEDVFSLYIFI
jgi:ABC-type branched-subunit amino acid transport system substrate-binding protein